MKLIDADELIVMEFGGIEFVPKEFIDEAPVVDAVPVVRCKDCINWFDNGTDYCSCEVDALLREANHFCSYGERRADNAQNNP